MKMMNSMSIIRWLFFTTSLAIDGEEVFDFIEHPASTTLIIGDKLSLSCKTNHDEVDYEWLFDEKPLDLAGNTLVYPSIGMSRQGRYRCRASSSAGTIVSTAAVVQVYGGALIDHRPGKVTEVVLGGSTQLVCSSRSEAFELKWLHMNKPVHPQLVLPNGYLELPNVREEHLGSYKCQVSFNGRSDTAKTTLVRGESSGGLRLKPTPPNSLTVTMGDQIVLPCHGVADGLVSYEWFKDGDKVGLGGRVNLIGMGNLLITETTGDDVGVFKCKVKGTQASSAVTIRLQVTGLSGAPVQHRHDGISECSCESSPVWYKNGQHQFQPIPDQAVVIDQDGFYQCFCPTVRGESYSTEYFVVHPPTQFELDILEVRAKGFKVAWGSVSAGIVYIGGGDNAQQYPFDDESEFTIEVPSAGTYEVKVELTDREGTSSARHSRWSQLVLVHVPKPEELPKPVTDLKLSLNNEHSLITRWTPVDLAQDYILIVEADGVEQIYSEATTPFEIKEIPRNIKVIRAQIHVKGEIGFSEPSEWVNLEIKPTLTRSKPKKPEPIRKLSARATDLTTAEVKWEIDDDAQVDSFTVKIKQQGASTWREEVVETNFIALTDLLVNMSYVVRVAANVGTFRSRWVTETVDMVVSPKFLVDKLKVSPDGDPHLGFFKILDVNSTTISVIWSFEGNSTKGLYTKIRWGMTDDGENESEELPAKRRFYKIQNLQPHTDYYVSARAYWGNRQSQPIMKKARTRPLILHKPKPKGFACDPKRTKGLNMEWNSSGSNFELRYKGSTMKAKSYETIETVDSHIDGRNHQFTLRGLDSEKSYDISIREIGSNVESDWTETITCTTGGVKLNPPTRIIAIPNDDGILIQWEVEDDRKIDGFTISYRQAGQRNWTTEKVPSGVHTCHIKQLSPETEYIIKVAADSLTGKSVESEEYRHVTPASASMIQISENFWYILIGIVAILTIVVIFVIVALVRHQKKKDPVGPVFTHGSQRSDDIFELQHPRLTDLPHEPPTLVPNPYQQILPPKFQSHAASFMTPEKAYSTRTAPISNSQEMLATPDHQSFYQQNLMYQQMYEQQELMNRYRHLQLSQQQLWIGQTPSHPQYQPRGHVGYAPSMFTTPTTPSRPKIQRAMTERQSAGSCLKRYRPYQRPSARRSMGAEFAFMKPQVEISHSVKSELPIRQPLKDPDSQPSGRKSGDGQSATGSLQDDSDVKMPPPLGPLSSEPPLSPVNE